MSDDFGPTASWAILRQRAELLDQLRGFFNRRSFLEVETPVLSRDTVIDRHLDPIAVFLPDDGSNADAASGRHMWLQTSPEFCMKRLLASGAPSIYQVSHAFRAGERGALHNPEFTMVEWYRVGHDMQEAIELLSELVSTMLGRGAAEPVSYQEAFQDALEIDPLTAAIDQLLAIANQRELSYPSSWAIDDRNVWLDLLFTHCVQPYLGITAPTILYDYPASQAALAVVRDQQGPQQQPVAERFELFVDGLELANGYHELRDPLELAQRNEETNRQRKQDGKPELPEESRLAGAMRQGLPSCAGVALGFDRLVMVATGADHIEQVIPFPIDRA